MDEIRGRLFKLFGLLGPLSYFVKAPFGKFHVDSSFNLDGKVAWVVQESIGPLTFIYYVSMYCHLPDLTTRQYTVIAMFLVHYLNRALIWPLYMMHSLSPSHIVVMLSAAFWQYLNGYLQAQAALHLKGTHTQSDLAGVALFLFGMSGNIIHDRTLANLRRKQEGYSIPYGLLFDYVSYPNYLCEWVEWTGYALYLDSPEGIYAPRRFSFIILTPTGWWFVTLEILVMLPRALRGHQFYKHKFGNHFPTDRKAIIPFLL